MSRLILPFNSAPQTLSTNEIKLSISAATYRGAVVLPVGIYSISALMQRKRMLAPGSKLLPDLADYDNVRTGSRRLQYA